MQQNNELSATSILSLFDTTKAERTSFVRSVINNLKDGIADPLKVHLQLKNTEALIEELSKDVEYKEMLQTEAAKHGKKFDLHNAGFQIKETGVKYNYDNCGDAKLVELTQQLADIQAKVKERQEWLKTCPSGGLQMLDDTTGELVTIFPPVKTSTTVVAVTLK